jgi:diguanylate cyclase (GGDEF)-like protein
VRTRRAWILGATIASGLIVVVGLATEASIAWLLAAVGFVVAVVMGAWLVAERRSRTEQMLVMQRLMARASGGCLWIWRRGEGQGGGCWYADAWQSTFGIAPGDAADPSAWFGRVHPEDIGALMSGLERVRQGAIDGMRQQFRMQVGDGWRWVEVHATADGDRLLGTVRDNDDQHTTRERLAHTAFHDPLTGLPNRALFLDRLSHCSARARRNPQYRFAVAFIDIDDFKLVNDSLGHQTGDALLRVVAQRLSAAARGGDTVARIGGDEFTILFDPIDRAEDADKATRRLRDAIHGDVEVMGQRIRVSTSVGIAMSHGDLFEPLDLLRDADTAMYHAKRLGSGRQQLFDQAMRASVVRRVAVETELRSALDGTGGQLLVHYQPVIRLRDGGLEGFEALVRLKSANGGLISPAEFIPLAEAQGLVDAILDVVLRQACMMVDRWSSYEPEIYVSVNVSARSVNTALVERVARALADHRVPAQRIKLELTESVLVGTTKVVGETLAALRELGIGLYIDDFGTGFSSLSYLHQFPADRIKLDRAFVMALDGQRTPDIVETIVTLSRRIGAAVIAEGIETETQLRVLRELGCLSGQGYFFAPGVPADSATQFVEGRRTWPIAPRASLDGVSPALRADQTLH